MATVPAADDDDADDHGGHQGHSGEGQGHVDGAALLQLNAANRVALERKVTP